ncbi:MAG: excinuclease ABC subunit UvrA [Planctomycetota bacterium]
MEAIRARGIRVHNLKDVDVDIPRGKIVAICGVSGSGKTSLALDTLYAEGQRRYIESFSAYTRQFLERIEKPDFDSIEGLPPALAVTRGGAQRGNRSTVGTASETLDYLRVLYAHAAELICYQCGQAVQEYTPQSVAQLISKLPKMRLMVGFSFRWNDVAERAALFAELQNQGFVRLQAGGRIFNLGDADRKELAQATENVSEATVIVDRLKGGDAPERTSESLETAFDHGLGSIELYLESGAELAEEIPPSKEFEVDGRQWTVLSLAAQRQCQSCNITFPDPEPRLFSFNSPLGACPQCEGFGDTIDLDWDRVIPDRSKSLEEGAIAPWNSPAYEHNLDELLDMAEELGLPTDVPFSKLTKKQQRIVKHGEQAGIYGGVDGFFEWLERKKYKMHVRVFISRWRSYSTCSKCDGKRLTPEALSYRIGSNSIADLCDLSVDQAFQFLSELNWEGRMLEIAAPPLEQVKSRLEYLQNVGLGYLQLSRTLRTLSGGEAQRTALTAALGSNLVNMLYVLDEPSVGLHPHDVQCLTSAIEGLASRGNTVVIVEHEDLLLQAADELIELGPEAGTQGGEITYQGNVSGGIGEQNCRTLEFLHKKRRVPIPKTTRSAKKTLKITQCTGNNLKSIDVEFPLGVLCVVAGVSGSGKSTLVQDTLFPAVSKRLSRDAKNQGTPLPFKSLTGTGFIDACIAVDQGPVSRSPRSNPVTYVKAFDEIRKAFAATPDAKLRSLTPGHFSFNSDLGRCPQCSGDGVLQIDMQFLADVQMTCPTCEGTRYRKEILSARYRNCSIADVLSLSASNAITFFRGFPKVQQRLQVLVDVGLGYLQLGQSATTLSSGEAQRLKLAGFLASASQKRTLFILDEPTTGLHFQDVVKLLECFRVLIESGHSLLVVEHNMHLVAAADHVIDLGPGASDAGGQVIAKGTPRQVAKTRNSVTGSFLREFFS